MHAAVSDRPGGLHTATDWLRAMIRLDAARNYRVRLLES
ncbi:MAG: hypothetical protein ACJAUC_002468 [Planctomycetota bacterium]|jgi:hypothetical protein